MGGRADRNLSKTTIQIVATHPGNVKKITTPRPSLQIPVQYLWPPPLKTRCDSFSTLKASTLDNAWLLSRWLPSAILFYMDSSQKVHQIAGNTQRKWMSNFNAIQPTAQKISSSQGASTSEAKHNKYTILIKKILSFSYITVILST